MACKTSVAPPSESVSVDESFGDLQHICINMEDKSTLRLQDVKHNMQSFIFSNHEAAALG